jgi:hypothetical protein
MTKYCNKLLFLRLTLIVSLLVCSFPKQSHAQTNKTEYASDTTTYRIIKTDGGELVGQILRQDENNLLLLAEDGRKVLIPQHLIARLVKLETTNSGENDNYGDDKFATRYFLTTNGLPLKKGEHYVQWNLYGPDVQFSVGENFGIGFMTTWIGMPMAVNFKKSFTLGEKAQLAVGSIFLTGSWLSSDLGAALPFSTLSFGDRSKNMAVSAGYGVIWINGQPFGRALTGAAGMIKIAKNVSLLFDSFIMLPGKSKTITTESSTGEVTTELQKNPFFGLFLPGVRWHQEENKAVQFGFVLVQTGGKLVQAPIPMIQWYRAF